MNREQNRDQDILDDIPSMMPERDELAHHTKYTRGTSATGIATYTPGQRTSGAVVTLLSILFIAMLATGGGAWFFYQGVSAIQSELSGANARIVQLENLLKLVDQASEQNAMDLVERVNFNFSEIDKLWAARNTLRSDVGELKTSMTAVQTISKELQATVGQHSKTLDENVMAMQARIDEINRNFSGMDNLGQQLTLLNADLNRVKTANTSMQDELSRKLATFEQDIESINVYRLQMNQTVNSLQDSVNRLQERVGRAAQSTIPGGSL
jgi:chromosome segregation ATPase